MNVPLIVLLGSVNQSNVSHGPSEVVGRYKVKISWLQLWFMASCCADESFTFCTYKVPLLTIQRNAHRFIEIVFHSQDIYFWWYTLTVKIKTKKET